MDFTKLAATITQAGVLRRLRSPCTSAVPILYGFSQGVNMGHTLIVSVGQSVVAPGAGLVTRVRQVPARWRTPSGSYHEHAASYMIIIDHGHGIRTVLHGLNTVSVRGSQLVTRGALLGTTVSTELWFGVQIQGKYQDPGQINRHFGPKDGHLVFGQGGYLPAAPNILAQNVASAGTVQYANGARYFPSLPVLVNVDFNGQGSKTGRAAVGLSSTDYWNSYRPVVFTGTQFPQPTDQYAGTLRTEIDRDSLYTGSRRAEVLNETVDSGLCGSFDGQAAPGGYIYGEWPVSTWTTFHNASGGGGGTTGPGWAPYIVCGPSDPSAMWGSLGSALNKTWTDWIFANWSSIYAHWPFAGSFVDFSHWVWCFLGDNTGVDGYLLFSNHDPNDDHDPTYSPSQLTFAGNDTSCSSAWGLHLVFRRTA
jgi:hypothetical protein